MQVITDSAGNKLTIAGGEVKLDLAHKTKTRNIGRFIKTSENTIYFKRARERNMFLKKPSWGIHWEVLNLLSDNDSINITTEFCTYWVNVKKAKETGEFLHFKNQGFEKQFFIPIESFDNENTFNSTGVA
tara:strand:+ start:29240 stop:29629 length:390 start_codon:yes stop_codon:yes gene_type:complete